jgi:hypothetical protein
MSLSLEEAKRIGPGLVLKFLRYDQPKAPVVVVPKPRKPPKSPRAIRYNSKRESEEARRAYKRRWIAEKRARIRAYENQTTRDNL